MLGSGVQWGARRLRPWPPRGAHVRWETPNARSSPVQRSSTQDGEPSTNLSPAAPSSRCCSDQTPEARRLHSRPRGLGLGQAARLGWSRYPSGGPGVQILQLSLRGEGHRRASGRAAAVGTHGTQAGTAPACGAGCLTRHPRRCSAATWSDAGGGRWGGLQEGGDTCVPAADSH